MSSTLLRIGLWVVLIVIVLYVLQQTFEEGPVAEYVGTPYSPRLTTASECQSSAAVGVWMLFTESIAAWAADAADDCPRFSITAAPRFWTISMNVDRSHS